MSPRGIERRPTERFSREAGVTVFATPRVGISAGYRYRSMWFDSASGVTREASKLRPRFRETSGSGVITGVFTF